MKIFNIRGYKFWFLLAGSFALLGNTGFAQALLTNSGASVVILNNTKMVVQGGISNQTNGTFDKAYFILLAVAYQRKNIYYYC